ncbi:MAG: M3 family metallopeptidase [Alphaproteobacteria bacterium]|nr:M3 family metallopeptidase [Alphaproteobacteria bacterium]
MTNNPLLEIPSTPNFAPPFDKIKTEDYLPAVKEAISEARAAIEAIKNNPAPADFKNTIVALETSSDPLGQVCSVFYNQLSSVGGDELHALAQEIGPLNADFSSDIYLDDKLFARVKAVYEARETLGLTPEELTLVEDTYEGFERAGAALPEDKKARLREIAQEMSTLSPTFMNNAKQSMEAFQKLITDKTLLEGLPESAIEAAHHAAQEKGHKEGWLITLDMPSYIPVMQFAKNRELREELWRARTNTAWGDAFDNSETLKKIVALRHERAQVMGYHSHADFVLEHRMAENPETVFAFLDKLKNAYKPAALKELEELKAFAQKLDGMTDMKQWDTAYYAEKMKESLFDFSSEELRPYFPLDNVLKGCFEHFSKLFGMHFKPASNYPVWHKDVQVFEVEDAKSGAFIGTLYADFHPRTGKNSGAWKTSYRDQGLYNGKVERPVVAIVCNFTKPTPSKPSLLTHDEVLTLFHEMGHAVHALLSNVTYRSLAGTNVRWDFVELPSQVQENWCYEKETLDLFAQHYETGEKIPADLVGKLIASKNFMVGMAGLRQVSLGLLDMSWHTAEPKDIGDDVLAFEDKAIADCALFPRLGGPISVSFGHIFAGGYSAGYYSYKWAEVLDADTFEYFKETGLYNQDTARKYREEILSKGGSIKPNILYVNFRGREADPMALLRREGLAA